MREFNALKEYPGPKNPRYVGDSIRTIENRIRASYRGKEYYDGNRNDGYGGFKYDGRWKKIAESMIKDYGLNENSSVLQIGCEKGFLLHDFHEICPGMKIRGVEVSDYAIEYSMSSIKQYIKKSNFDNIPFNNKEFDLVIAIGVVYTLTLSDAISCLKEIERVSKGKSFITLGAYKDERGERLFKSWSVLGSTILHVDEWIKVMQHAGYTGDYYFKTADNLQLIEKRD